MSPRSATLNNALRSTKLCATGVGSAPGHHAGCAATMRVATSPHQYCATIEPDLLTGHEP